MNKIDWISFSFKRLIAGNDEPSVEYKLMIDALISLLGEYYDLMMAGSIWVSNPGRAPYEQRLHNMTSHVNLFWHTRLDHALIEMSGQACDWLAAQSWHDEFLRIVTPRLTRLDIAKDIQTNLDPIVFAGQRDTARFRSHSEFVSESGITAYVGSRTSNRYARVYRYHPPHERAHLLRVEMVSKAEDAKLMSQFVLEHGLDEATAALGAKFGWAHPAWSMTPLFGEDLVAYRPERRQGKTVFWLADTVAPLLLRLEQEGVIDIDLWFADHIAPKRKKSGTL